jgi:hypothetical protein
MDRWKQKGHEKCRGLQGEALDSQRPDNKKPLNVGVE